MNRFLKRSLVFVCILAVVISSLGLNPAAIVYAYAATMARSAEQGRAAGAESAEQEATLEAEAITGTSTKPAITLFASTNVKYWDRKNGKIATAPAETITAGMTTWGEAGAEKWYVVNGTVEINTRVTVTGDVHLILADGAQLKAKQGINVSEENALTIYGQTDEITSDSGKIEAYGGSMSGIGGTYSKPCGKITITGGIVDAKSIYDGAGIGGGSDGDGGIITISGGMVTATSKQGAGIGGGASISIGALVKGGTITISGGTVTAKSESGAGIGGGKDYNDGAAHGGTTGGNITISGGTVTAKSLIGAGIGGGAYGKGANIRITDGTVTASSGGGAGIGGGLNGAGDTTEISGGTVTAESINGAGIGGGNKGAGGNITISGGTVKALVYSHGSGNGAGIGGGCGGDGGNITISGGTVVAATAGDGAGIGGGGADRHSKNAGAGGNITISGGMVWANSKLSHGIGGGISKESGGQNGANGSFSTGTDGKAMIRTKSIADKTGQGSWQGIIFEGRNGNVYGNQALTEDFEIKEGRTLTIPAGSKLTVPAGKTLTIKGTLKNEGTLENNGTIENSGTLENSGKIENNGKIREFHKISGNGEVVGNGKRIDTAHPTPAAAIDYNAEKLTGLSTGISYQITPQGSNADEVMPVNNLVDIKAEWFGKEVSIIAKEDDSHLDSLAQNLNIPARPAVPAVHGENETAFGKDDGKITGTTVGMEYKLSAASEWKPCTAGETVSLAPGKYVVRIAATSSSFVSEAVEIEIKKVYRITVENNGNGTAEANPKEAPKDTEITLSANANSGHYFKEWQVVAPLSGVIITNNKFTMPESDVTVKAVFTAKATPALNVTLTGWTYGETANNPAVTGNTGSGALTYEYFTDEACTAKTTTANSGAVSEGDVPAYAGKYWVRASLAETQTENAVSAIAGFEIKKANQALFYIGNVTGKKYGDLDFALETTGGSGSGAVTYSVPVGNGVLSVSGATASILGAGEVTVTAVKAGGRNYHDSSVERKITIAKAAAPVITFPAASSLTYGQKLSASTLTGGSTKYGTFAWTDGEIIPAVGNTGYEAAFTPSEKTMKNYEPIPEAAKKQNLVVAVAKAQPTMNLTVTVEKTGNQTTAVLSAEMTGASGANRPSGTVKFSYQNGGTFTEIGTAALTDGKAVYSWENLAAGEYTVKAEYVGDSNYSAAQGIQSLDTRKKNQDALSFNPIGDKTYGDDAFSLSVIGGSGSGEVTYSVPAGNGVLEITGNKVRIIGAGTVILTARKAADAIYNETGRNISLTVAKRKITVKAEDKTIVKGAALPAFTYNQAEVDSRLAKGDTFVSLTLTTTAANTNTTGEYEIAVSGGTLTNASGVNVINSYEITYQAGTLTIANAVYEVTVADGSGSGKYSEGQTVTIKADKKSGYIFTHWLSADGVTFANAFAEETSFIMPAKAVTVTAAFKGIDPTNPFTGQTSQSGDNTPASNTTITIRNEAAKPFLKNITDPDQIRYVDRLFDKVPVIEKKAAIKGLTADTKSKLADVLLPRYSDVKTGEWYSHDLTVINLLGLVEGTSASTIAPTKNVSGQELMTILVRSMSKNTKLTSKEEATANWYAPYAKEAALLKLDEGIGFDLKKDLTRAEVAELLYRYVILTQKSQNSQNMMLSSAESKNILAQIKDRADIPADCQEAVAYLYKIEVFKGYEDGSFLPNKNVSRIEVITLVERLLER